MKKNEANQKSQTKDEKEDNLKILYDKINILTIKGINIPKDFFCKIKDYLIKVKIIMKNKLSQFIKKKYLRLLSRNLFRKIKQYQ